MKKKLVIRIKDDWKALILFAKTHLSVIDMQKQIVHEDKGPIIKM